MISIGFVGFKRRGVYALFLLKGILSFFSSPIASPTYRDFVLLKAIP
ncbi:MAG: hypothetical protein QXP36_07145 [Conexivisphaerales archaeon]